MTGDKMRFQSISFILVALLASAGACGKNSDGKSELPPPTGAGATPRKELPKLTKPNGGSHSTANTTDETTGTTHPHAEAKLAPNMSGVLAKVMVEQGDKVKKGQLVFRLRTTQGGLYVKQAKAALHTAKVNLSSIKVEYDRTKRLFEQNAVNKAAWDRVKAQYDGAQAGIEQAKVGVAMAKKALSDAYVRSPINGVVTAKLANEGEMVTMMPPTIVVVVEDHSILDLKFRLPERSLATIAPGDAFTAVFESVDVTREAKIVRINPRVDPRTRTVEIIAELANKDFRLKPGMLAEIDLGDKAEPPAPAEKKAAPAKKEASK
jgi:RND family efflux transporter MFP subunit